MPPAVLRAGRSPDRPAGRADGIAGHGGADAASEAASAIEDRASAIDVPLSAGGRTVHDRFVAAIDDDLDMPVALRIARQTLRAKLSADERRWLVLDMDFVLALDLHLAVPAPEGSAGGTAVAVDELPAGAADLFEARARARASQAWVEADRLRDALRELGVEPVDRADGSSDWRRLP